jgi:hypothetical protein
VVVVVVVVVAAGAELADPRVVRTSHLAWQSLVILMPTGKSFAKVELAATRVSSKIRLLWRLETWDLRAAVVELGLDGAESAVVDSWRPFELARRCWWADGIERDQIAGCPFGGALLGHQFLFPGGSSQGGSSCSVTSSIHLRHYDDSVEASGGPPRGA